MYAGRHSRLPGHMGDAPMAGLKGPAHPKGKLGSTIARSLFESQGRRVDGVVQPSWISAALRERGAGR